ncbi:MAG: glutaminase A [Myxococcaceae bacterium]
MRYVTNRIRNALGAVVLVSILGAGAGAAAQQPSKPMRQEAPAAEAPRALPSDAEIQAALKEAHAQFRKLREGKNADYIPILAKVNPNLFGIALVTVDGRVFQVGDAKTEYSIQSVAKPFTLALVLEEKGPKFVEDKIGLNATGQAFNSIVAVEMNKEQQAAGNPMVNAGAIATVSQVAAASPEERWKKIDGNLDRFAGRDLQLDPEVYKSETDTNTRNQSITRLLEAYEVLGSDPEGSLDAYTRQSSVNVNTVDLAMMGATLANGGVNPADGQQVVSPETAQRVVAQMATNGLYETSGEWLTDVGAPAKSGVGGGIVAVVPGKFGIAAFSPPLDEAGNSVRAQRAIELVVNKLHANLFASTPVKAPATGGAGKSGQPGSVPPNRR